MKKLTISILLAAVLATTGCMQMEMKTDLAKDGSGTYFFSMSMSTEVEEALKELSGMEGGMGDDMDMPDFADFDKGDFEKKLGKHDVKLKSFANEVKDGVRTVNMTIAYKNFQGLQAAMALASGGGDEGIGIEKMDDGNYLLHSVENPFAKKEEAPEEKAAEPSMEDMQAAMANAGKSMELMGKLMAHSSELSMEMSITLPSDVIEHNAPTLEGRTCKWLINSENMMAMEGMEPRIVFSGKGVDIK